MTATDHDLIILDPRTGHVVGRNRNATDEQCAAAERRPARRARVGAYPGRRARARHAAAASVRALADELVAPTERKKGKPYADARGGVGPTVGTLVQ